jgi:predicted permease
VALSLSLGIGSIAAVFNLFDFLVFRSFPVPETQRVVRVMANSRADSSQYLLSNREFEDLRDSARNFEGLVSVAPDQLPFVSPGPGQPARGMMVSLVSGEFFSALHIDPQIGRGFRPEEDEVPGRDAVAVISYDLWKRDFEGSWDVLGRTIRMNSRTFTIIGVAPEWFYGLDPVARPSIYLPRMMESVFGNESTFNDRTSRRLQVIARLKDGVEFDQARLEIERIGGQLERDYPETNRGRRIGLYTQFGAKLALGPEEYVSAGVFFLISGLVLTIACVNVANMLLSTAPARTREMAIRVAIGASRGSLVRQMLLESVMISMAAAFAGLVLASGCARFIRAVELFPNLPIRLNVAIDGRVVLFVLGVSIAAGLCAGLIPALQCSRANLNGLMKSESGAVGPGRMRVRRALVVLQVAVAVLVIAFSAFSIEELRLLASSDPGFATDHILRIAVSGNTQNEKFASRALERLRALSGVRTAAAGYPEPLGVGTEATNLVIDGYTLPPNQNSLTITSSAVSDDYFRTMDIPILQGRAFDVRDMSEQARVAIINEAMAAAYWPGRDPLSGRIRTVGPSWVDKQGVELQIVGIARNSKYRSRSERPMPFLYLPMKQSWTGYATFLVRTEGDPASLAQAARKTLTAIDPAAPIYDTSTMAVYLSRHSLVIERLFAQILSAVGVVGLILSVLGLYGVVSYLVSRRTQEIGIRMALGASRGGVFRLILTQGMKLTVAGVGSGIVLAFFLRRSLDVFFSQTNAAAPVGHTFLVYAAVVAGTFAVAMFACYLPARRASGVDPNIALRCDNG